MLGMQQKQMALQMIQQQANLMQNPDIAQAYSQMLGGGQSGGADAIAQAMQQNPLGASQFFPNMLKAGNEAAKMRLDTASAGKVDEERQNLLNGRVSDAAAALQQNPTPSAYMTLRYRMKQASIPDGAFADLPQDPSQFADYGAQVYSGITAAGTRAETSSKLAGIPELIAKGQLTMQQVANYMNEFGLKTQQYNLDARKFWAGEIKSTPNGVFWIGPDNSGRSQVVPLSEGQTGPGGFGGSPPLYGGGGQQPSQAPQGLSAQDRAGVTAANQAGPNEHALIPTGQAQAQIVPDVSQQQPAQPLRMEPGPTQQNQIAAGKEKLKSAGENAEFAARVKQVIPLLEQALTAGNQGAFWGSNAGKEFLNTVGSIPGIEKLVDTNALANTKSADTLIATLVGPLVHEMSARGSNMALKYIQSNKPETQNLLSTNLQMLRYMGADADNLISRNAALNKYGSATPQDYSLAGFKEPQAKAPQMKFETLPPPGAFKGRDMQGDDGIRYHSDGKSWIQVRQ
jgi:hypothetical protein